MTSATSNITIGLQVNLRGAMKLDTLNAAFKNLKTTLVSIQKGTATSGGFDNLARSFNNVTKAAQQSASARTAAERKVATESNRINQQMAAGVKKWYAQDVKSAADAAKQRTAQENMYAKMFDQIERQTTRSATREAAAQARAQDQANRASLASTQKAERAKQKIAQDTARMQGRAMKEYLRTNIVASDSLVERLRKVETEFDAIFRAGFRIQMVGNQMKNLGVNTLNFLQGMTDKFGDFEFMLNRAAGAMGILDKVGTDGTNIYQRFQGAILDAASQLRLFDPTDVAKATYYWASTSGQQIDSLGELQTAMKAVIPLMKEAALTETDYQTTIKGVYSILIQYGKGLGDVQDVTEKLQKATVETAAEFPDLINSFKMVGPVAAANNVTFEDMVGIFGRLADAGIRGSMAGRAFRQMFIQLVKPSDKAKDALEGLWKQTKAFGGKSYAEMVFPNGSFVGPLKYIDMLAVATKDLTQVQRNQLLAQISTANELPVLTALVAQATEELNGNAGTWKKVSQTSETAAQAFERQWQQLANSWKGVSTAIKTGVDTIRIQIGGRMAKIFTPVMDQIIKQLGRIREWLDDPKNSDMIDFWIKAAGAVGVFLTAIGSVAIATGSLIALAGAIAVAVRGFSPLIGAATGVIGIFAALASAVQRNFEYIRSAVMSALSDVNEALGGTKGGVEAIQETFESFMAATRPIFDFIVRGAADLIRSFGSLIKILSGLGPVTEILRTLGQALLFVFALRTVNNILGVSKALGGLKAALIGPAIPMRFLTTATGEFEVVAGRQAGVLRRAADGWRNLGSNLKNARSNFTGIGPALKGAAGGLMGLMGGPLGLIALASVIGGLAYESLPGFRGAVDNIAAAFKDWKAETEGLNAQFGDLQGQMDRAWESSSEYVALQERLAEALERQRNQGRVKLGFFFGDNDPDTAVKNTMDSIQRARADFDRVMMDATASLSKEMDISLHDFSGTALALMRHFNVSAQEGARLATMYYESLDKANDNGTNVLDEMSAAWEKNQNIIAGNPIDFNDYVNWTLMPGGKAEAEIDRSARKALAAYQDAMGKVAMHRMNPEAAAALIEPLAKFANDPTVAEPVRLAIQKTIADSTSKGAGAGFAEGFDPDNLDPSLGSSVDGVKEGLLVTIGNTFKNFDEQVKAAIDKYIKPGSALHGVLNSIMTGAIKNLPKNVSPEAISAIASQVSSFRTLFDEEFKNRADVDPATGKKFAQSQIRSLVAWMGKGIPKETPKPIKDALYDVVVDMYRSAGATKIPQDVIDLIYGKGGKVPYAFSGGIKDDTPTTVTPAAEGVPAAATTATTPTPEQLALIRAHGGDVTDAYRTGINDGKPGVRADSGKLPSTSTTYTGLSSQQITSITSHGKSVAIKYGSGINSGVSYVTGPIGTILSKIYSLNKWEYVTDTWGRHLMGGFYNGMKEYYQPITTLVNNVANTIKERLKFSEPEKGPLVGFNKSGGHLMQGLIAGIESERSNLIRTVNNVARDLTGVSSDVMSAPGVSLESNASKLIKVQVEVSSPDGSVNKMTTAQLERSIMSNDLILSLEHMATVG